MKANAVTDQRVKRLEIALRENLKRRKAQLRGRREAEAAPAQPETTPEAPPSTRREPD